MREAVTLACWPPGPDDREARSSISASGIVRSCATRRPWLLVVVAVAVVAAAVVALLGLRVVDVGSRRVRVGRTARDRLGLVVVGVVDLLAVDLDAAVLVAA